MNFGPRVAKDSERDVTSEGSISPWINAEAVPKSAVHEDEGVDAVRQDCVRKDACADPNTECVKDVVLGMGDKRRKRNSDGFLESEGDVPASDLAEFVDRMNDLGVERNTEEWTRYWKEHAELRLEHNDPVAWAEYVKQQHGDAGEGERAPRDSPQ